MVKKKTIDPEKFYKPTEVVGLGRSSAKDAQVILRHIRAGKIPQSVNVGSKKRPRYVVQGKYLIEYFDKQIRPQEYETK